MPEVTIDQGEFRERFERLIPAIKKKFADKQSFMLRRILRVLQNQESDIFDRETSESGAEWKRISALTLITRQGEVEGAPFDSVESLRNQAEAAKPLVDQGNLRRSLTERTDDSIFESEETSAGATIRFGTSRKGAKRVQEGGASSGFTMDDIARGIDRVSGEAASWAIPKLLLSDDSVEVPAREFLYIDDRTPEAIAKIIQEEIAVTIQEVMINDTDPD